MIINQIRRCLTAIVLKIQTSTQQKGFQALFVSKDMGVVFKFTVNSDQENFDPQLGSQKM